MGFITTSTSGSGETFSYPPLSCMDRSPRNNDLWCVVRTAVTTLTFFRSVDNGTSWSSQGSISKTGLYEIGEMRIDRAGDHIHLVYLSNVGGIVDQDVISYRRIRISNGPVTYISPELDVATAGADTPGAYFYSACIFPHKNPDNTFAIAVAATFHGVSGSGVKLYGVSIKADSALTTYRNSGIVGSTRSYALSTNDTQLTVSCDLEHTGDGINANWVTIGGGAPPVNLWYSVLIGDKVYVIKLVWMGYKTGWRSPASATKISQNRNPQRDLPSRWDGVRFIMLCTSTVDISKIDVFERNRSNTRTTVRTTPVHPLGTIAAHTLSYNYVTQDFRIFAVANTPAVQNIYHIDYNRTAGTWGSWTLTSATVVIASEWGVRRGIYGNNQYDVYLTSGAGSPYTVSHLAAAINYAPTAPTWVYGTGTTPSTSGAAFDATSNLALDWTFNDPNPSDTQLKFALSRQIGAATVQYWRVSDGTWQATEQENTTGSTALTLTPAQWLGAGGAADAAHSYKVKTWDQSAAASPYSAALTVTPSARVDPTLTAPTPGQILNGGRVVAEWTVAEQSAYRVTITNAVTGVLVRDSGWHTEYVTIYGGLPLSDTRSWDASAPSRGQQILMPDGFQGTLTLQTKNAEGLPSAIQTVNFSCVYIEPVAAVIVPTAAPSSGGISVAVTQAAATGSQPATVERDLYHRVVAYTTPTNSNPTFEVNIADWTNSNYSSIARSTAQFHSGAASILLTPNGSAAAPYIQTSGHPVTGGGFGSGSMGSGVFGATADTGWRWEFRGWFRSTTANKTVRAYLMWYDVSFVLISSTVRDMTPVAGVWIWCHFAGTAPTDAATVRLAIGQVGTPASGDTLYADDLQLLPMNDDEGIRIAANLDATETVLDWRTPSGVDLEYRLYVEAENGAFGRSPWTA